MSPKWCQIPRLLAEKANIWLDAYKYGILNPGHYYYDASEVSVKPLQSGKMYKKIDSAIYYQ
jgi:hypothetical protein